MLTKIHQMPTCSDSSANVSSRDDATRIRAKAAKSKATSLETARIRSAVSNGKQTRLPSETGGNVLSKFDHHGRDGRLSVFAEEANHKHSVAGRFKIITTFQPANSIHNQLFFGKASQWKAKEAEASSRADKQQTNYTTAAPNPSTKRPAKADTFEELIVKFKSQRQKSQTGKEHLERLELLDSIYKRKKEEWKIIEREFSCLEKVRKELNGPEAEIELRHKTDDRGSVLKLPVIKVSPVRDAKKKKMSKQNSKSLKIPKERIGSFKKSRAGVV